MVRVESYFKVGNEFVPIADYKGQVLDPVYVEGSIELEMDGVKVLTRELWDDINHFWPYIAQGLIEITKEPEWSTYFPDQPIKLTFRTDVRRQNIAVDVFLPADRVFQQPEECFKASASYDEFMTAMSKAARKFFRRMAELIPEERADWEREIRILQDGVPIVTNSGEAIESGAQHGNRD